MWDSGGNLGHMKSIVMKSIYTGLGLLGSGKETVEQLGRKLARQANVSEQEGKKIARQLRRRSQKAIDVLHETLDTEVAKVVKALNAATKAKSASSNRKARARRRRASHKAAEASHP